MRAAIRALLTAFFVFGLAATALAEKRVALIVGNADYKGAPLENPTVDADLVAASLTKIGFAAKVVKNGDLAAFDRAIVDFAEDTRGADVALFYFAGHGFTVNEGIKPVSVLMAAGSDVTANSERVLRAGGIPLDDIIASLTGKARATLVFVDACRNDPRVSRAVGATGRGFGPLSPVQGGSLFVGLSTRLGETAQDGAAGSGSPFARAFSAAIETKDTRIDDAFRQLRDAVKQETDGRQIPEVFQDDLPKGSMMLATNGAEQPIGERPVAKPSPSLPTRTPEASAEPVDASASASLDAEGAWAHYRDAAYGTEIDYPPSFRAADSGVGRSFDEPAAGGGRIHVFARPAGGQETPKSLLAVLSGQTNYQSITYKYVGKTKLVVSGYRGDLIYYESYLFGVSGTVHTLAIEYSARAKPAYAPIITRLARSFVGP